MLTIVAALNIKCNTNILPVHFMLFLSRFGYNGKRIISKRSLGTLATYTVICRLYR